MPRRLRAIPTGFILVYSCGGTEYSISEWVDNAQLATRSNSRSSVTIYNNTVFYIYILSLFVATFIVHSVSRFKYDHYQYLYHHNYYYYFHYHYLYYHPGYCSYLHHHNYIDNINVVIIIISEIIVIIIVMNIIIFRRNDNVFIIDMMIILLLKSKSVINHY